MAVGGGFSNWPKKLSYNYSHLYQYIRDISSFEFVSTKLYQLSDRLIFWLYHPRTASRRDWLEFISYHGPLTRYVKLQVVHVPGMPGTCPPCVAHVEIANPRMQGKRSLYSRRMSNPQFYISEKRPIALVWLQIVEEKYTVLYINCIAFIHM